MQMSDISQQIAAEIPRLRRYAQALTRQPHSADDLVQDCLTRALAKSHLWQEGSDLRAWLFTILHNQFVNSVRRSVREGVTVSLNIDGGKPGREIEPSQEHALTLRDLDQALAKLPEDQRVVVLLVGLEGLAYDKVAEILGVPVGTVRSRLSRGREMLRRLIGIESTSAKTAHAA
jgi:RNA polymerase sigma-70 factor (ECF subfamily)